MMTLFRSTIIKLPLHHSRYRLPILATLAIAILFPIVQISPIRARTSGPVGGVSKASTLQRATLPTPVPTSCHLDAMDDNNVSISIAAAVAGVLILLDDDEKKETKIERECWVRIKDREDETQNNTIYKLQKELIVSDPGQLCKMMRMPPEAFFYILEGIRARITRTDTNYRMAISAEERLSLTLRYMTRGDCLSSLAEAYRIGYSTVPVILADTCQAIYECFAGEYMKTPQTTEEWNAIESVFRHRWQYPGCVGAMDGKHIKIVKPWNSGSDYFNYKQYTSIILFAIVNGDYEIMYANVGSLGRSNDGGIWGQSDFKKALDQGVLNIPETCSLPDSDKKVPYHFVADDAFAMSSRVLKPYSHRDLGEQESVYNYRLSRARRIVENVFGIMANKYRVLRNEITLQPPRARQVVLAICTVHNIMRRHFGNKYLPAGSVDTEDANHGIIEGEWRNDQNSLDVLHVSTSRNYSESAKNVRNTMASYFTTDGEGRMEWQYKYIVNTYQDLQRLG